MKKMPCIFRRQFEGQRIVSIGPDVTPGCEWVLEGRGFASRKWDGTACLIHGGTLYARYDSKLDRDGKRKEPPEGWIACQPEPDPVTGHWPGWVQVTIEGASLPPKPSLPEHKWHLEALGGYVRQVGHWPIDGTYEAIGPKINANRDGVSEHVLKRHGDVRVQVGARSFEDIRALVMALPFEGLVFAHPDGRMAKIRRADFGASWPTKAGEA